MLAASAFLFPPFHLDLVDERLWRGTEAIVLRRKTFAVLRYLVEHADQLVTKEALFAAVWPRTVVSEVVSAVCMRELRKALGDDHNAPAFVETVHGRGYRFIAPVSIAPPVERRNVGTFRLRNPHSTIGNEYRGPGSRD